MANAVIDIRKTFSDDPILLLSKLGWEIAEIHERGHATLPERIYLSLNAAHSAWHMHQWIWELATEKDRDRLVAAFEMKSRSAKEFGLACRRKSGAIEVCRQISVAGKHVAMQHDRSDVFAKVLHDPDRATHAYSIRFAFDGQEFDDTVVYNEAIKFWQFVYVQLGFEKSAELLEIVAELAEKNAAKAPPP